MLRLSDLKNAVTYCPSTGIFNRKSTGNILGKNTIDKYISIEIMGVIYRAHRLAWMYVHGAMPNVIDHLNGDITDNRIKNLKNSDMAWNMKNKKKYKNNSTGVTGVYLDKKRGLYRARVGFGKNYINLGYFKLLSDAKSAVELARKENGYPKQR